jgi:hypothetical protein
VRIRPLEPGLIWLADHVLPIRSVHLKLIVSVLLSLAITGVACAHERPQQARAFEVSILLNVESVTLARDSIGRDFLSIAFILPQEVRVYGADPRTASRHGYAIFERPRHPGRPWIFSGLSARQVYAPPKRIGIVADWNTGYSEITPAQLLDASPTAERLAVLERYRCSDIAARLNVSPSGIATLAQFVPLVATRGGPPCFRR